MAWRSCAELSRHAVVIGRDVGNDSAYLPDLLGCVATGATFAETDGAIRGAIAFHLDGLREDGLPIPAPTSRVDDVRVEA